MAETHSETVGPKGLPDDLIKAQECADIMRIGVKTLYRQVQQRLVPHYRLNGEGVAGVRFSRREIMEHIASRHVPVNEERQQ